MRELRSGRRFNNECVGIDDRIDTDPVCVDIVSGNHSGNFKLYSFIHTKSRGRVDLTGPGSGNRDIGL
jgi:hypothetical protein